MGKRKMRTPLEDYARKKISEAKRTAKMDMELSKYGKRAASGGMVWTGGDLARFFLDKRKKR